MIDLQEAVALNFALRYMNSFAKATPLANQVRAGQVMDVCWALWILCSLKEALWTLAACQDCCRMGQEGCRGSSFSVLDMCAAERLHAGHASLDMREGDNTLCGGRWSCA